MIFGLPWQTWLLVVAAVVPGLWIATRSLRANR